MYDTMYIYYDSALLNCYIDDKIWTMVKYDSEHAFCILIKHRFRATGNVTPYMISYHAKILLSIPCSLAVGNLLRNSDSPAILEGLGLTA